MKNRIKLVLFSLSITLLGCNSDDNTAIINVTSEFVIDEATTYLTPNGYLEQCPYEYYEDYQSDNELGWFALTLIDGEYAFLDPQVRSSCPSAEHLNHGVSIWPRLDRDTKLEPGTYDYAKNDSQVGIMSNSEVFYDFKYIEANYFGVPDYKLNIADGELKVEKETYGYAIIYNLT
ncbi:hypothetical protein U6A24_04780 [Aquimarina gracilis]|uniref:Uncharacterized protein n=1 Tax=Aquimarina gracilis TaxID=874422 RepID=A0ABU5ZRT0_9FLAO|nr:hypothetical protein [Aquimarina gracilis]MEB3344760.1 hypothetical protein [Aquimarina gracilis]